MWNIFLSVTQTTSGPPWLKGCLPSEGWPPDNSDKITLKQVIFWGKKKTMSNGFLFFVSFYFICGCKILKQSENQPDFLYSKTVIRATPFCQIKFDIYEYKVTNNGYKVFLLFQKKRTFCWSGCRDIECPLGGSRYLPGFNVNLCP